MKKVLGAGLLALVASGATGQVVVVPNANATVEGNSGNSFPFGLNFATQRYQQVFAASEFGAITAPTQITVLKFRGNATSSFPPWSNDFTNLVIKFSTVALAPDALSTTFADNPGANEMTAYSGPATLSTAQMGPATGPLPFDMVITLQTPFTYNPAAGNLLIDIFREGFTVTTSRFLDSQSTAGDSVSRVFTNASSVGGGSAPTGTADTNGLIVQFTFGGGPTPCYANCDASTLAPILNVNDFTCFINQYAAGSSYANCDASTLAPVLNVNDFTCFINRYAAGCI